MIILEFIGGLRRDKITFTFSPCFGLRNAVQLVPHGSCGCDFKDQLWVTISCSFSQKKQPPEKPLSV